jgi:ABC-type nitrate/sulfonate/bicarbonate transport system permease component
MIDHLSAWVIVGGTVFAVIAGAILAYVIGHAQGERDVIDEILTFVRENAK